MDCPNCPYHNPLELTPSQQCLECIVHPYKDYDITLQPKNQPSFVKVYHARSVLDCVSKAHKEYPEYIILDIKEVK